MKVVAFNGSPRKKGNTTRMLTELCGALEKEGVETEVVQIGGQAISGCKACYVCKKKKDGKCSQKDDIVNECIDKMRAADGIVLASPTYFSDVTAEMKALIDRSGMVCRVSGDLLKRKVGAGVAVARRGGSMHAFDTLTHYYLIGQMIVVGSSYWNLGFGMDRGEVEKDEEAMSVMRTLGENMAWTMNKLVQ